MKNTKLHIKTFQELTVDELYELLRVRSEVFVMEQDCVYQDMDGDDKEAIHVWLTEGVTESVTNKEEALDGDKNKVNRTDNEKVVALARVCPAGVHLPTISIGRVITTVRGKGYGKQIMLAAIDVAQKYFGATSIDIEAQEYAKGFYEGVGFKQTSDTFMLDGIPHIKMRWKM
jgi:ElaA protein